MVLSRRERCAPFCLYRLANRLYRREYLSTICTNWITSYGLLLVMSIGYTLQGFFFFSGNLAYQLRGGTRPSFYSPSFREGLFSETQKFIGNKRGSGLTCRNPHPLFPWRAFVL
jgi:hypothetical protein